MLITRTLTAIILLALVTIVIFCLPPRVFVVITVIIALWLAWEWASLAGWLVIWQRLGYLMVVILTMVMSYYLPIIWVLIVACLWWLGSALLVISYPYSASLWVGSKSLRSIMGLLSIVPAFLAIHVIYYANDGITMLWLLLLIVWMADIGAYVAGRLWGRQLLLPRVSPKKTWQGIYGGLLLSCLTVMIACLAIPIAVCYWPMMMVLALVVFCFSVVGDLLESMLKRARGVKDSGFLLPGHGGLLDRLDSLLAAAPVFLLGIWLIGWSS